MVHIWPHLMWAQVQSTWMHFTDLFGAHRLEHLRGGLVSLQFGVYHMPLGEEEVRIEHLVDGVACTPKYSPIRLISPII